VAAARRVFADRGYRAPLSSVAREAGVGQGVLYRHFPDRLSLAFAAFDEHWAEYAALSQDPAPDAFERLWALLVRQTIDEAAFVEMVVEARRSIPDYDGSERMRGYLAAPLARAVAQGRVDPLLSVEDVMLAQRMVYGVVATSLHPQEARESVARALATLSRLPPLPA